MTREHVEIAAWIVLVLALCYYEVRRGVKSAKQPHSNCCCGHEPTRLPHDSVRGGDCVSIGNSGIAPAARPELPPVPLKKQ